MESQIVDTEFGDVVHVAQSSPHPSVIVVCEHASNRVPDCIDLSVSSQVLKSHVAWDPGALGVAKALSEQMSGVLVFGGVSRLVYDCNRPPEAESAMPARSENFEITGNIGLSAQDRARRIRHVYTPFSNTVSDVITHHKSALHLLVTIHSFTAVYMGKTRDVELGLLHGEDARFATAMMQDLPGGLKFVTRLNEPYGVEDGVSHTLNEHGVKNDLLNVMIEIRNDLIETEAQQSGVAAMLAPWLERTLAGFSKVGPV